MMEKKRIGREDVNEGFAYDLASNNASMSRRLPRIPTTPSGPISGSLPHYPMGTIYISLRHLVYFHPLMALFNNFKLTKKKWRANKKYCKAHVKNKKGVHSRMYLARSGYTV